MASEAAGTLVQQVAWLSRLRCACCSPKKHCDTVQTTDCTFSSNSLHFASESLAPSTILVEPAPLPEVLDTSATGVLLPPETTGRGHQGLDCWTLYCCCDLPPRLRRRASVEFLTSTFCFFCWSAAGLPNPFPRELEPLLSAELAAT